MWSLTILLGLMLITATISLASGYYGWQYMSKAEDAENVPRFLHGIIIALAGGICVFVCLICAIVLVANIGEITDGETYPEYLEARCKSVEGTYYAEGHCYKNGVELTWKEENE